jgi:membrane-bound metal-dependent hydrolase YbcI (DUF457 family)
MGQVGLHAITGLAVGDYLVSGLVTQHTARRALLFGFVMGNIFPDLDYIAVAAVWPINPSLALGLHRGFSHSLLAAAALAIGFYAASILMNDTYVRWLGFGLALGVVAHLTEDMLIWFSPVDVFWPASLFGIIPSVNLWSWWNTPPLIGKLLGAAEFAAFAFYYDHLVRLAQSYRTNLDFVGVVRTMATSCWITWAILSVLALDLPGAAFSIWLYVPMGVLFMPGCLYLTWRMQETIQALGRSK